MNRNISYSSLLEKAIIILLIIAFLLFILYPIVGLFIRSLTEGGEWSLYYYKDLFKDENLELIRNSVFVASLSSICATILALSIGLYAHFKGAKIRNYIYRGLMISMISPPFISSLGLLTLFGRRGLISYGLLGLTLNPYGWHGIVLLQSLGGIPLSAMFIMAGLNQIDSRLILASRDLGANTWQTLKNVILPSLIPTILSVLFLRFTMNISDFTTPIIIGGRFNVLATEAYLRVYAQANLNGAAAMTVLLLPPALMAFFFYNKNLQKTNTLSDRSKILDVESLNFKLPKLINFISATITVIFFIIMVVQYGNIFIQAISRNVSGKLVFTTDHLHFFQTRHFDALLRTIYMALIAGLLSTIFGLLLSYYNRMRRIPGMKSIEFIGSLPYIIPGIFFGLAYIVAFHNGPIKMTGTLLILIINCTFRHVSVGTKAANAAFENIDKKLEWASYDLGASKLQSLCTLIFPMLRPTFLTSFINAFTASMTTVGPLMLLISPKNLIISVLMFSEVSNGRYGQAAVMGVSLILITFTVNLIAIALMTREKRIIK
ncbi:MAG: iron ABC transporter permease [Tissierellia bacterium]|nr:iron ABC transporter permease [Tissierellia bacterium]MDD4726368.1 iron ABC transporter permease [Tissierellia bacterium]